MYRDRYGRLFGRYCKGRGAAFAARERRGARPCPQGRRVRRRAFARNGSYTGLRIGVSFAKGLCYGVRKPLVAVGSLDALAEVALEDYEAGILSVPDWEHACLCPMVDARRMEVYAQVFDTTGKPLNEVSAEVVDGESFAHFRSQGRPFVIFGSGARKCAGILPDAVLVEVAPSARGLARLAQRALDAGCTEDIAYFEPFYLKDFVVTTSKKKLF